MRVHFVADQMPDKRNAKNNAKNWSHNGESRFLIL